MSTIGRVLLRDLVPEDAANILLLNSDPEVLRHVHDVPFADEEAARRWILAIPKALPLGYGRWSITLNDGTWIGRCSLRKGADGITLMGYRLLRAYWGKGYATETAASLLQLAFDRYDELFVMSHVAMGNFASARVLEKNGARLWAKGPVPGYADGLMFRLDRPAR